jgi:hypothetical protein
MERDYPALCDWVRHQTVSTDALRLDLLRALAFVTDAPLDAPDIEEVRERLFRDPVFHAIVKTASSLVQAEHQVTLHGRDRNRVELAASFALLVHERALVLASQAPPKIDYDAMVIPLRPTTDEEFADLPILDPAILDQARHERMEKILDEAGVLEGEQFDPDEEPGHGYWEAGDHG